MFRIVTKLPKSDISRKYQNGSFRLCKSIRQYSKEKDKKDFCPPPHPKTGGTGTIYTIGALTLLSGGTLGLAKYNPDFRDWLKSQAPFTDPLIKFIFQEEMSYYAAIVATLNNLKDYLLSLVMGSEQVSNEIPERKKEYYPPSPAFSELAKETKDADNYTEIRLEKKTEEEKDTVVEIAGDVKRDDTVKKDWDPRNLAEMEIKIGNAISTAIKALNTAVYAVQNYSKDVELVLQESTHKLDPSVWDSIKQKAALKNEALKKAEIAEAEADSTIKKFRQLIAKKDLQAPPEVLERAKLNIQQLVDDMSKAKADFRMQAKSNDITHKYWNKVKAAREHFSRELETLFPNVDFKEQKFHVSEGELDVFMMHAVSKVLHYQKQIAEMETVYDAKLNSAIEHARRGGAELLTTEQICVELEKARRRLEIEFHEKCLKLKFEGEKELREKLKLQSQAFADHLADALRIREEELTRILGRDFDEKLTEERCKFKAQVGAMVGRLKGMDDAFKERADTEKIARKAQVLWSACQALYRSIRAGCPGREWKNQIRPLEPEITAVQKAAAKEDELVKVIIDGIPPIAKERGVYPEDALRERFIKVEKIARSLALVPAEGARLHIYILSYIQSLLLLKAASPIPQSELNDETVDFSKLSTNEILQRARYWMDRGDFMQTLKYMNLLKGASRVIASQWMEETRLMLETQQAANTLMAHAAASGLLYM